MSGPRGKPKGGWAFSGRSAAPDTSFSIQMIDDTGRRTDVSAGGFVKAGSDLNLVYVLMSFCAGLAGR